MKVKRESCRMVKPCYEQGGGGRITSPTPLSTTLTVVPLSVFDTATFDNYVYVVYAYRPPTPPNSAVEEGLARVLWEYRELAGRLGRDGEGRPAILLNDEGVRFVEASAGCTLDEAMPLEPSWELVRSLHPEPDEVGEAKEPVLVQLTRFACGSLVLGFTAHHQVLDGASAGDFMVAWSKATRGLPVEPLPPHARRSTFPRRHPHTNKVEEFQHRGVEFIDPGSSNNKKEMMKKKEEEEDDMVVVVHKVHFTVDFLAKLKEEASGYSTFERLAAHLWRVATIAREVGPHQTTAVRIPVDGRRRLKLPNAYLGNLVLCAFPRAKAGELVSRPLAHAAGLIHDAVAGLDAAYFRSFVEFASSGAVEAEGLVPAADGEERSLCPDLDVTSWLRLPFQEMGLGGGKPDLFMPSYLPVEGEIILLPSSSSSTTCDGSIDAFVPLFRRHLPAFQRLCCHLETRMGAIHPKPSIAVIDQGRMENLSNLQ